METLTVQRTYRWLRLLRLRGFTNFHYLFWAKWPGLSCERGSNQSQSLWASDYKRWHRWMLQWLKATRVGGIREPGLGIFGAKVGRVDSSKVVGWYIGKLNLSSQENLYQLEEKRFDWLLCVSCLIDLLVFLWFSVWLCILCSLVIPSSETSGERTSAKPRSKFLMSFDRLCLALWGCSETIIVLTKTLQKSTNKT